MEVYVSIVNYVHKCYKCFDSGISLGYVGTDKVVAYKKALKNEWLENYITDVDYRYDFHFDDSEDIEESIDKFISLLKNYNSEIKYDNAANAANAANADNAEFFDYIINDDYYSLILEIDKSDEVYGSLVCNPLFLERWENVREDKFYKSDDISYYRFNVNSRILNDESSYEE